MSSNILSMTVLIQGVRPILWHRFGPDALPLEKQEKTGVAGNVPDEWKKTVAMDARRRLFLPPEYVFACLRDGAKNTPGPRNRGSLQKAVSSSLQICDAIVYVFIGDDEQPLIVPPDDEINEGAHDAPDLPVFRHVSGVRNPSTNARNVRYRIAAAPGWRARFTISWDKTVVSSSQMEAILNDAGKLAGLADGRSIGYGRFQIMSVHVHNGVE